MIVIPCKRSHMRRVKPDKPEQRLTLQSVNGFEDIVFEAKAKAKTGQPRGQGQTIEFCPGAVLEVTIAAR